MGGGSRIKQYERRFFEGEQERGEREEEAFHVMGTFGEYEVRESEDGGYELLKGGEVIGIFHEAKLEEDRIVFRLSHGMNLEVSEKGVGKRLSPEKAELCGLIASDGYISKRGRGIYEASLATVDKEMVEVFKRLSKEVYDVTSHVYLKHHETEEGRRENYEVVIFSKEIFYDLQDLGIKGPEHYEFHPPLKYLDEEGKRAYLRGFFSGDGTVSVSGGRCTIRIDSTCREGLEELRETLISLGFHPCEIYKEEPGEPRKTKYSFHIPEGEHMKFIEEIWSERQLHKDKFKLIRQIHEEKDRRRKRKENE